MTTYDNKSYDPDNICEDDYEYLTQTGIYADTPTLASLLRIKNSSPTPVTVVHSGSTNKALDAFEEWRLQDTLNGLIVLTIGANKNDGTLQISSNKALELDILHLHKIDKADFMRVLNVNGYIGSSTSREIAYARMIGKRVVFLEYHPDMLYPCCVSCNALAKKVTVCQFCGFCFTCIPSTHEPCEAGYFIDDIKLQK